MKINDYIHKKNENDVKIKAITRVIDIYKNIYLEYTDDLKKPLSNKVADDQIVVDCFKYLCMFSSNPRVLNTLFKIIDIIDNSKCTYANSNEYQNEKELLFERLRMICI